MKRVFGEKTEQIEKALTEMHPNARCELNYSTAFELLTAVILSAQCTDKRVNLVTPELFRRYGTPESMAQADAKEISDIIRSCGFYNSKTASLLAMARAINEECGGIVPNSTEKLVKLKGVGRKTANVVLSEIFNGDVIAVDTHVGRVAKRLGLTDTEEPLKAEAQLMNAIPEGRRSKFHHLLIFHGRYVCKAQKPDCRKCRLNSQCAHFINKNKKSEE